MHITVYFSDIQHEVDSVELIVREHNAIRKLLQPDLNNVTLSSIERKWIIDGLRKVFTGINLTTKECVLCYKRLNMRH